MTDGPYKADEIHLESSLGYYLSKARNVLVERMDRAVRATRRVGLGDKHGF